MSDPWNYPMWLSIADVQHIYAEYEAIRDDHADASHVLLPVERYQRMCDALGEQVEMTRIWKNRASSQRSKAMRRLARLRELGEIPPAPVDQEAAW